MRDGILGVVGTSSTILLQEVSLWLSIVCALVTLTHFGLVFNDRYKQRGKNARVWKILWNKSEDKKKREKKSGKSKEES